MMFDSFSSDAMSEEEPCYWDSDERHQDDRDDEIRMEENTEKALLNRINYLKYKETINELDDKERDELQELLGK